MGGEKDEEEFPYLREVEDGGPKGGPKDKEEAPRLVEVGGSKGGQKEESKPMPACGRG